MVSARVAWRKFMNTAGELKTKALSALDVGLFATFIWTCFSIWIAYTGPSIVTRSTVVQGGEGWSRATMTVAEESQIRSFLIYTLAIHATFWASFWVVRRLRRYAPRPSDAAAFVIALILTICYLPAFLSSWMHDAALTQFLWPLGFPTLCSHLAYLDVTESPFVYGSAFLKLAAVAPAFVMYAAACLPRTSVAHR
jgi:hypothetical protein